MGTRDAPDVFTSAWLYCSLVKTSGKKNSLKKSLFERAQCFGKRGGGGVIRAHKVE